MTGSMSDLWRWPLHSPRRLFGTLAVITLLVVGLSFLFSAGSGRHSAAPAPGPTPVTSSGSSPSAAPAPSVTPSQDFAAALDTAKEFTAAWASHPADWRAWYAGAAQYATDDYARLLTTVDPANIKSTKVSGPARLTDSGQGRTEVAVPTDGGPVSVLMVDTGGGHWKVNDLRPGAQAVE
ncbi:hypothetical protein [Streptomyces sp. NPDC001205]